MAYRTQIELALDEMISEETGKKFQGIAVVHAKQKWPHLVACERNWDGGLDAYASGELEPEGKGIGLACSITATPSKVEDDAGSAKKNYPDLRVLIFSTPKEVTQHTAGIWAKDVLDKFGVQLIVVPREEFITWLHDPANSDICRDQLGITESSAAEIDALIDQARERVNPREAKIAIYLLEQIQRTRGGNLSDWQRFRVLTNLGASHSVLEEGKIAARYFLDAAPLAPNDQKGVENEVLAYNLLLQEKETREKADAGVKRFPNSTRIRSHVASVRAAGENIRRVARRDAGPHANGCRDRIRAVQESDGLRPSRPSHRTRQGRRSGQAEVVADTPASRAACISRGWLRRNAR